jgi:hypothetical protein
MLTLPNLAPTNWLRDTFPDLLWPASLMTFRGESGLFVMAAVGDALAPLFPSAKGAADNAQGEDGASGQRDETRQPERTAAVAYDGRLTSLEAIAADDRAAVLEALRLLGTYEHFVPAELAHVLGLYPSAPGRWLIQPLLDGGLDPDPEIAERHLAEVISNCQHGQTNHSTWVKASVLGAAIRAGRMTFRADLPFLDLLRRYPSGLSDDERASAESMIRANFQATATPIILGATRWEQVTAWARTFWRSNWNLFECQRSASVAAEDDAQLPEEYSALANSAATALADLRTRFVHAAHAADPDLYAPDRHEVLTGIVGRALRLADAVPGAPILWTDDLSAFVLRAVLEAQITFEWLRLKDELALYERFKDYGRGRLKLLKLHFEDYADSLDEPPQELFDHLESLNAMVNEEIDEEWQQIDVSQDFAGVNRRTMATEVGLEREYRLLFQPLSDATHGEWSTIQAGAIERCRNATHRWHWIPRLDDARTLRPDSVQIMVGMLDALVSSYEMAFGASGSTGSS